ncbi:DNA-binding response regulator [Coraliomargarita sinensis]|uniref:DNA-binding response regulator n=1 Tax=Coraliomargarita sinensis TaxID=2174842 RepID=A0A317ZGA1_9BACT|nr:response regulator transcription factor [Coraliomargarita sinensis]PXA04674.1 DNA-binding response regulator [Coraliomargarita sinensis]
MNQEIRIVLVEDNKAYTKSLLEIIGLSGDMVCVETYATTGSCESAYSADAPPEADVILLDLKIPQKGGLSLVPMLRERAPDSAIVVLTSNDDYRTVLEAIKLGVVGYVLKDTSVADLRRIIREVNDGGSVIDPQLSRHVLAAFREDEGLESGLLSDREREVLELMAEGLVKKEVAEKLGISYSAVALYTSNIYEKLQVPNVAAAVATAIRKGII